jgi:AraC-like DNA-binding protein
MSICEISFPANVFGAEEESWRQRVGALIELPALLRQFGTDPAPVIAAAGLEATMLECAESTIPYAAFGRLMEESAQQTRCEYFGLLAGQSWKLSTLGILGQLIRNSSSLSDGLRLAIVYHHINSHGGVAFLRERGAVAEFGYAIYYRGVHGADHIYDGVLAALVNYMRELCGPGWVPAEVLVAHAPPAHLSPYHRLFGSPVRFNSEVNALRFSTSWLNRPVAGANLRTLRKLEKQASELPQPDLIEKLHRSLRVLLLSGVTSGDALAEMLAIHRRTLNRRLKAHGTTFREVLDDVRFEAACQLLAGTQLPLNDIAAALGYAEASSFTRAFRRRSGSVPGRWRQINEARQFGHIATSSHPASQPRYLS